MALSERYIVVRSSTGEARAAGGGRDRQADRIGIGVLAAVFPPELADRVPGEAGGASSACARSPDAAARAVRVEPRALSHADPAEREKITSIVVTEIIENLAG